MSDYDAMIDALRNDQTLRQAVVESGRDMFLDVLYDTTIPSLLRLIVRVKWGELGREVKARRQSAASRGSER